MNIAIIALLVVIGFIFLIIELLIVPGFSIPGLVGIGMIGYGIFMSQNEFGTYGALIVTLISVAVTIGVIRVAFKTRLINKVALNFDQGGAKALDDYSSLIGKEGVAVSTLRPAGTAKFDSVRYDVVSDSEFIEKQTKIVITAVEGRRIIVSPVESKEDEAEVNL